MLNVRVMGLGGSAIPLINFISISFSSIISREKQFNIEFFKKSGYYDPFLIILFLSLALLSISI